MRTIELILEEDQNYFMHEAFNTLRTNILFSGKKTKVIIVTSCIGHEGKTTVSFDLSNSLTEVNKKVLLVDADLRKSVMVSRYTKDRGIMGLSQWLSGQAELDQVINKTQNPNFDIVFAGPYPPNPTALAGSPAFKELLDYARDIYDYVIVDAPPLGLVIDAAVMANFCDGAVFVINAGSTKRSVAQNVKDQLQKSGCKILGVILNNVNRKDTKGSYYYYGVENSEDYYEKKASEAQYHSSSKENKKKADSAVADGKKAPPSAK
ncbi:MAG: CpsD/CapB family tyrosine-protein kinase [Clostridia bacterium]|nr:CpsD/CapB family tyrosine-protein kinase [Clostridia bacterium]